MSQLGRHRKERWGKIMGRGSEYTFFQRRYTNGNLYRKRCSTSLIIREMKIKTTMKYLFIPVRVAPFKKTRNNK